MIENEFGEVPIDNEIMFEMFDDAIKGVFIPGRLFEDLGFHYVGPIDGHRINDSVYDQAAIGTDFPLDVDLIDRVEIVRGPSSSLYGTNAFLAVVNVIWVVAPRGDSTSIPTRRPPSVADQIL